MESLILEKATQLFLNQGFKSVTMDDIAMDLSISKKTIYQYYTSKPELIEKCLAYLNNKLLSSIEATVAQNKTAIAEILTAHEEIESICQMETSASIYQLNKYYPKLAQKQKAFHRKKYFGMIEANLKKGIKEGVFKADLDVEFITRLHITSVISLDDPDYFDPNTFPHNELHKLYLDHHMSSITTEKGMQEFLELKKTKNNE